jgi:hypothetical protein
MLRSRLLQLTFLLGILIVAAYPPAASACGLQCILDDGGTTPTTGGIGTDCTAATNSLKSQLQTYARAHCPASVAPCQVNVTITTACHLDSGGISVSGYETYGCEENTCL